MVRVDMTQPDRDLTPGVDLWEIIDAEEKTSRNGDKMLKVKLCRVAKTSEHLYDNIMLEGGGWPIGKAKLSALIPADFKGDLDPKDLISKRVWVSTGIDEYEGKQRLKVMVNDLKCSGYQPFNVVPNGCTLPADNEPPF